MLGDQKNRLIETFHLSTHNKCFGLLVFSRLIAFLLGLNNIFRMLIILECFFPCLQTVLKLQIYKSTGILKNKTATIFYTPGKICFLGAQSNHHIETIILSTHKACFWLK